MGLSIHAHRFFLCFRLTLHVPCALLLGTLHMARSLPRKGPKPSGISETPSPCGITFNFLCWFFFFLQGFSCAVFRKGSFCVAFGELSPKKRPFFFSPPALSRYFSPLPPPPGPPPPNYWLSFSLPLFFGEGRNLCRLV